MRYGWIVNFDSSLYHLVFIQRMTTDLFKSIYITMRIYTTIVQTKSITWNNSNEILNALKWALYCSDVLKSIPVI